MSAFTDTIARLTDEVKAAEQRAELIRVFAAKGGEHRISIVAETDPETQEALAHVGERHLPFASMVGALATQARKDAREARQRLADFAANVMDERS